MGAKVISDDVLTESNLNDTGETDEGKRVFLGQDDLKISTIFNTDTDLDTLINSVAGNKWTIDYYSQMRDVNDPLAAPDPNIPPAVQKYRRIENLIIYLQKALDADNPSNITGEAIINAGFLPLENDAIVANLSGGRDVVMLITNVSVQHHNLHQVYSVEFKLMSFIADDPTIYNNLLLKTVKVDTYVTDHVMDGSAPIILKSDYVKRLELKNIIPELLEHYIKHFLNSDRNVLSINSIGTIYTDTLLTDFIFATNNVKDCYGFNKVTRLSVDLSTTIDYTIWDNLLRYGLDFLKRCKRNVGFKYTPYNPSYPTTRNIFYLGISFIVNLLNDKEVPATPTYVDIAMPKSDDYEAPLEQKAADDYSYVFSANFYNGVKDNFGLMEKLIYQFLAKEELDMNNLYKALVQYPMWSTYEQFYLIPILVMLVRYSMQNNFKNV